MTPALDSTLKAARFLILTNVNVLIHKAANEFTHFV